MRGDGPPRPVGARGRARLLTHCNTGRLATAGDGTALGVIYAKHAAGELDEVIACEARPLLQGGRLTAWELGEAGVPAPAHRGRRGGRGHGTRHGRRGHRGLRPRGRQWRHRQQDRHVRPGRAGPAATASRSMSRRRCSSFDAATPDGARIVIEERAAGGGPRASVACWSRAPGARPSGIPPSMSRPRRSSPAS